MRVLITGGAGFIGSHLSDAMIRDGHHVAVLDDLSTGSVRNLSSVADHASFQFVEGSVLDAPLVSRLIGSADAVVHLAAAVGVRLIVDEPLRSMHTNLRGTENVLEAASGHLPRVLIASSSEVYGKSRELLHEDSDRLLGPTTVDRWSYSVAKSVSEIYAFAYWREFGVPTVVTRFFNTVGPRQTGAYGMVVPRLVAQALLGEDLTVYGDGTQTRSFCHVADVVRAQIALLEFPAAVGQVYNVGSNDQLTILDLAHRILNITGSSSSIRLVPFTETFGPLFEDVPRRSADTSKLENLLGWEPKFGIDDIIEDVMGAALEGDPGMLLGRTPVSR
jgi:UDP-glucose 4-epimerase